MKFTDIPFEKDIVVMGVGNPDRGDDGVGVFVSRELIKKGFDRVISCGGVPENYIAKVCSMNPDIVLIVDAVNMGKMPGAIRVLDPENVFQGITSHNAGIDIMSGFIKNSCGAEIYLLGIQPESLSGDMTGSVKKAGEKIVELLAGNLCMNQ